MTALRCLWRVMVTSMMFLGAGFASAQEGYPNKVVRIITPASGGGSDVLSRLTAPPEQFAAAIKTDMARIRRLARDANIKVDGARTWRRSAGERI